MQMREYARRIRDKTVRAVRQHTFRRAVAGLAQALRAGRQPSARLLEQMVYGWGNEAWSADASFLAALVKWLPRTTGPVVECGPGISTMVLGSAAAVWGRQIHCLEHNSEWAERILRDLPAAARPCVEVNLTPIKSYGDFDWYSLEGLTPPAGIGMVVCDGPPGGTRGGRYGLSQVLGPYLRSGCIILVDDTQRAEDEQVVRRWCSELSASVIDTRNRYTVLSVGGARM